jgi:hypothetical protein
LLREFHRNSNGVLVELLTHFVNVVPSLEIIANADGGEDAVGDISTSGRSGGSAWISERGVAIILPGALGTNRRAVGVARSVRRRLFGRL